MEGCYRGWLVAIVFDEHIWVLKVFLWILLSPEARCICDRTNASAPHLVLILHTFVYCLEVVKRLEDRSMLEKETNGLVKYIYEIYAIFSVADLYECCTFCDQAFFLVEDLVCLRGASSAAAFCTWVFPRFVSVSRCPKSPLFSSRSFLTFFVSAWPSLSASLFVPFPSTFTSSPPP